MADENETPEQPAPEGTPAPEEALPPEEGVEEDLAGEEEEYDDTPYSMGDFHNVIHKQLINAVVDTLSEHRPHWEVVGPILETAREICRGDFQTTGSVQLHGLVQQDEEVVEAEEAYVEFTIADQDDGHLWFQETFWLSDIILTDPDPDHVRDKLRALERTIGRLNQWLAEREAPPAEPVSEPGGS